MVPYRGSLGSFYLVSLKFLLLQSHDHHSRVARLYFIRRLHWGIICFMFFMLWVEFIHCSCITMESSSGHPSVISHTQEDTYSLCIVGFSKISQQRNSLSPFAKIEYYIITKSWQSYPIIFSTYYWLKEKSQVPSTLKERRLNKLTVNTRKEGHSPPSGQSATNTDQN
jgi:hypothetical protein